MHRSTYSRSQDLLHARDPGLFRLNHAFRTTLSVFLTGIVLATAMHLLHLPIAAIAPGVLFSMLAPMFSSDPQPAERLLTYAVCAITGAIAFAVSAEFDRHSILLAQAWQIAILFTGLLLQVRGSRFVAPGVVSLVASYIGIFTHPAPQTVDIAIVLTGVAFAISSAVLLLAIPLKPAGMALGSVIGAATLQASAIARLASLRNARRLARRLDFRLARLHAAVLAVEDQLRGVPARLAADIRRDVFDLEVSAERLASCLRVHDERGRVAAREGLLTTLNHLATTTAESVATHQLRKPVTTAKVNVTLPAPALAWRVAIRGALAGILAVAVGYAISPDRSFWAVVAVYIAFFGVASRGHAVYKSTQRMAGTCVGVLVCAIAGHWLGAHAALAIVAILVCVFFWSYFIQANYALGVLFITIMVGLVYGALGDPLGPILVLRLKETITGVAGALAIAVLFLPARTDRHIAQQLRHLLRALDTTVAHCMERVTHGAGPCPLESMRRADVQLRALRSAMEPKQRLSGAVHCELPETQFVGLAASAHWLRTVARLIESGQTHGGDATTHAQAITELKAIHKELIRARDFNVPMFSGSAYLSDEEKALLAAPADGNAIGFDHALRQLRKATETLRFRLSLSSRGASASSTPVVLPASPFAAMHGE